MKYVPNALSFARIVLAVSLFFIRPVLSVLFLAVYLIAGFTDMADGPLARKFKVTSKFGANLDGIADYIFVAAALITIIPVLDFNRISIGIVIGFATLKILGMIVGYLRFKQLMMMHTYASKTGAILAFLFPVVYQLSGFNVNTIFFFLGAFVHFFLLEEIAINLYMPYPKRDITSVLEAYRIRREYNLANRDSA